MRRNDKILNFCNEQHKASGEDYNKAIKENIKKYHFGKFQAYGMVIKILKIADQNHADNGECSMPSALEIWNKAADTNMDNFKAWWNENNLTDDQESNELTLDFIRSKGFKSSLIVREDSFWYENYSHKSAPLTVTINYDYPNKIISFNVELGEHELKNIGKREIITLINITPEGN